MCVCVYNTDLRGPSLLEGGNRQPCPDKCLIIGSRRKKISAGRRKSRNGIKTTVELKQAPRNSLPHQGDVFLSFPQFSIELLHCSRGIEF